jgi:hypothetical protein
MFTSPNNLSINYVELEDSVYRANLYNNFIIAGNFKIQQFTDSCLKLIHFDESKRKQILKVNRMWGQDARNVFNLKRLCNELLIPIENIIHSNLKIVCGIVDNEIGLMMGLPRYSQLKYGKAAIIKSSNSFAMFELILQSNIKFSECIYFTESKCIYVGLPSEVLKDVVKIK